MPAKPKHPCNHIGCTELTSERYCPQHQQDARRYDRHRAGAAQRGYDARWRRYRAAFLRRHPLCAECERAGRLTPATVVDHIVAHKGNRQLFWDPDNHQPLCASCHNRKTASEDMGTWM
ncbi:MAG: HNH endonuclease [Alicyclobacillus sp.]|nr:HNH endonuclease [Alicyclobacillus sp.]